MNVEACQKRAFTLLELLVVIGIIALLSTLGLGALRGFNAINVVQAGNRQLLDDINRARNSAQNERTTVYMVFVPGLQNFPSGTLTPEQRKQLTNRISGQFTSYNFVTLRTPGDQPGRGRARYLSEWKHLPNGVFVSTNEFIPLVAQDWLSQAATNISANTPGNLPFPTIRVPFPTANSPQIEMPCIAFNYRGALVGPDPERPRQVDEIVTLTRGSLVFETVKDRLTLARPETIETPKNNYTNNPFIRIDWITGRARLEEPKPL